MSESARGPGFTTQKLLSTIHVVAKEDGINLTYTPVCTCLIEEETAYHYMYLCADYDAARAHTNPSTDNWESVISFLNLTRRLMF
ncbi:hypothetical protein EB796_010887 [Bugula neritina]|uniref:Uncharacterized protein n=1 Tax=Bugula neritina TaxID=10212 RepID=A0A7J7JYP5_BUGNE|nr:hypothetical protein EB796_010887 [Bugula neritina]